MIGDIPLQKPDANVTSPKIPDGLNIDVNYLGHEKKK